MWVCNPAVFYLYIFNIIFIHVTLMQTPATFFALSTRFFYISLTCAPFSLRGTLHALFLLRLVRIIVISLQQLELLTRYLRVTPEAS